MSEGMDVLVYAMTGCGLQGWISSMDLGALVLLYIEVILYLDAVMLSTANDGFRARSRRAPSYALRATGA
jgi:hypothetical protein